MKLGLDDSSWHIYNELYIAVGADYSNERVLLTFILLIISLSWLSLCTMGEEG